MSTKTALEKLNETQKNTLDSYGYMMAYYEDKGNKDSKCSYYAAITGYIHALEELAIITHSEGRLLKIYFTGKNRKEFEK